MLPHDDQWVRIMSDGPSTEGCIPLLLPVKSLTGAKHRLADALSAHDRRLLVLAMLADVVEAGLGADLEPIVVSPDEEVLDAAERAGARPLREPDGLEGLNEALTWAIERLAGASAVLILLPDTPLVTPSELMLVCAAALPERGGPNGEDQRTAVSRGSVVAVPDRAGRGTNALLLKPSTALRPYFGPNSFARHRAAARRGGIRFVGLRLPGISLDLDTTDDMREFLQTPAVTHTRRMLIMTDQSLVRGAL